MIIDGNKTLVLDMDGTIADLYGVENWLQKVDNFDVSPFEQAKPLVDTTSLNFLLALLQDCGWRIVITSWLSKTSNPAYDIAVRNAKLAWLDYYGIIYDEIHILKYGTTKANATRRYGRYQVLVDDNEKVLKGWHLGHTINASKDDILEGLMELLNEQEEEEKE